MDSVVPDLTLVRDRLGALPPDKVNEDLAVEVQDLLEFWRFLPAADIATANKVPDSGLAWSISRRLSRDDVDTRIFFPLAHITESLKETVAPALEEAKLTAEAASVRALASSIDRQHKVAIAKDLLPIEDLAAVPQDAFQEVRHSPEAGARAGAYSAFLTKPPRLSVGKQMPLGTLAFSPS